MMRAVRLDELGAAKNLKLVEISKHSIDLRKFAYERFA